jgi:hypothetical protein
VRAVAAAVTVAAALMVLSIVSSRGQRPAAHPTDRHPPPIRSVGMLRSAGGKMWWLTGGCRLVRMTMSTQRAAHARGRYCRAWPAPDGSVVLAASASTRRPLVAVDGASLRPRATLPVSADRLRGPVAWSPDSLFASACTSTANGPAIVVLSRPWHRLHGAPGRCLPAYTPAATALTSDGRSVFENGVDLGLTGRLAGALGVPGDGYLVTAVAATRVLLLVAVRAKGGAIRHAHAAVVVFNRPTGAVSTLDIPHAASELGAAPDGRCFWYRDAARGTELLEPLVPDGVPAGLPATARAYAWSPDGRYAVAAMTDHLLVVDTRSGATGLIAGRRVVLVGWTRAS